MQKSVHSVQQLLSAGILFPLFQASLFDIETPLQAEDQPMLSYRYWVKANRRVLQRSQALGDARFLLLNFDELCLDPEKKVTEVASFLGLTPSKEEICKAARLVKTPQTTGRYLQYGSDYFKDEDLAALEEFGFTY